MVQPSQGLRNHQQPHTGRYKLDGVSRAGGAFTGRQSGYGPSAGETRTGAFGAGGTASARTDRPSSRWSRRIRSNCSALDFSFKALPLHDALAEPPRACPETPFLGKDGVMSGSTSKRYPAELRERAVRMVGEIRADHESDWAAMT